jgi:phosphonate C-P lyase system protein PhnG
MTVENKHGSGIAEMGLSTDYTLCECELEPLKELVTRLEPTFQVEIGKAPSICLAMVPAEDSLEAQKFYLGEALVTECEVTVDGNLGFGLCLGEQPVRAYCIAFIDALMHGNASAHPELVAFLAEQGQRVSRRDQDEYDLIMQTKVDFKLMEEA